MRSEFWERDTKTCNPVISCEIRQRLVREITTVYLFNTTCSLIAITKPIILTIPQDERLLKGLVQVHQFKFICCPEMEWFSKAPLSNSLRPLYGPGEVEKLIEGGVDIFSAPQGENKLNKKSEPIVGSADCYLSTHKIYVVAERDAFALPLSIVEKVRKGKKSVKKRDIVVIDILSSQKPVNNATITTNKIAFGLTSKNRDTFLATIEDSLSKKAWIQVEVEKVAFSTKSAGVGGILESKKKKVMEGDTTMGAAFQDLTSLMEHAKKMVNLAERVSQMKEKDTLDEAGQTMMSLGIDSPVTKENSGALYYRELSKQLADNIEPLVEKSGGMLLLTDVYCIFNRARGTAMISPEELVDASKLLIEYSNLCLRTFESQVNVIQSAKYSDEDRGTELEKFAEEAGIFGVSAKDLSKHGGISVALAVEQLVSAERAGFLCRDETINGLRFCKNIFV